MSRPRVGLARADAAAVLARHEAFTDMDVDGIGEAFAGHAVRRLALPFHVVTFLFAVAPAKTAASARWRSFTAIFSPTATLKCALVCFPHASPTSRRRAGKQILKS